MLHSEDSFASPIDEDRGGSPPPSTRPQTAVLPRTGIPIPSALIYALMEECELSEYSGIAALGKRSPDDERE
jgi:hypothetical protein